MTKHLTVGEIPFNRPRLVTGRYLLPSSFVARSGMVPAALNHWRDNDHKFTAAVTWGVVEGGLMFYHVLDDEIPFEAGVLERVKRGELYWSHGDGAAPEDTRRAIAAGEGRPVVYAERPLTGVTFSHASYVQESAFPQEPIRWVGF